MNQFEIRFHFFILPNTSTKCITSTKVITHMQWESLLDKAKHIVQL